MPDKLLMAAIQSDGERLKDILNKEDAAAMVSGNLAATRKQPTPATINPVLLRLACSGDSAGLDFLFNNRVTTPAQAQEIRGNLALYTSSNGGSDDVEEGGALPAPSSLLEGVTVEGDTALHAVATCGHGDNFLRSADIIHRKARNLLFVQNKKGDTPLHCAARAGNLKMVSCLIRLAKLGGEAVSRVKSLLEKENKLKETALHEAVRIEDHETALHIVEQLMKEDHDLAGFPRTSGTSPLYLAILLENDDIVEKLFELSDGGLRLSYCGPNGQNALHAAATRRRVFTEKLLRWEKALSSQQDETGSTPLHCAAARSPKSSYSTQFHDDLHKWRKSHSTIATQIRKKLMSLLRMKGHPRVCLQMLEANPAALYVPDHRGSYPIHIATSVGATRKVLLFLNKHPGSAGLRDARGRTFLHVAVEKMAVGILYHATSDKSLAWILNMRDKDGNTAMHLAVQGGRLRTFCRLLGNRKILLDLPNAKGETCLDLACYKVPPGLYYSQNSEACIRRALAMVGARSGTSREDNFEEKYERNHRLKPEAGNIESDGMKDATQTLSIGSVLIATVTFGATFALPGGYKADDQHNGGSPTLAGTYAFDAFMMANTLAFICASMATVGFMFSGTPMVNRRSRKFHLRSSVYFMEASVTSLTAAFALGVYMVLAPVAYKTAIAVCAVAPFALLWKNVDYWKRWLRFAGPFWVRKGLFWTLQEFLRQFVWNILLELWPLVITFCWAAFANTGTHF